jgi:hypothetical protein
MAKSLNLHLRRPGPPAGLDARHGALGLVLLAVALEHAHRLAVAELAPQLLLEELRVLRDHRVGRAQDVAGAAVVLLQRDDLQRG